MKYERRIRPEIAAALEDTRVVNLIGARQVGKTTLGEEVASAEHPMRVFTLDDLATREAAVRDPSGFIASINRPALIDEIQRAPDLLLEIKRIVDRDKTPGQFLLTGSSNILTSKRVADALTGRVETVRLWPLMQTEIEGGKANFIDAVFEGSPPDVTGAPVGRKALENRLTRGGFPEAIDRKAKRRSAWFQSYVGSTLTSDLKDISGLTRSDEVPSLLRLIAAQAANVLTYRKLAEGLDINHETVKSYIGLLEELGLIVRIPGWRPGFAARETQKPKVFVADTGMLCHLLGADETRLMEDDQVTGRAVENFVTMEVVRHLNWSSNQVRAYHYHQADRDIDILLERTDGAVAAIEVKSSATVRASDYRWLEFMRDKLGSRFVAGVVICTSDQRVPLGDRLWSAPISCLWQ